MIRPTLLGALLAASIGHMAGAAPSACAPSTLVHIVAHDISPDIDPHDYVAKPKTMYRIGSDRMRSEEAPDPEKRIQGVFVVDEPNIWIANLYDMAGQHMVDPGPSLEAHAPIVTIPGVSRKIQPLELGCEMAFVQANAPRPVRSERIGGRLYEVYRVSGDGDAAEVLKSPGAGQPAFVRYYHGKKLVLAIQYDLYKIGEPYSGALFSALPGVRYVEAGPQTSIDIGVH